MELNIAEYQLVHDIPQTKMFYHEERNLLVLQWSAFVKPEELKESCEIQVDFAAEHPELNILSDTRGLRGTWTHHLPYLIGVYTPAIRATGLRKFAFLISENNPFHEFSAKKNTKQLDSTEDRTRLFKSESEALDWLVE